MSTHPMWVCRKCKFSQYHPMVFCPRCPGRLQQQTEGFARPSAFPCDKIEIPHPDKFKTSEEMWAHIRAQGLEYEGEYAQFDRFGNLVRKGV